MSEYSTKIALRTSLKLLMKRKPISKIKVEDILVECGVSRSTFYRLFKNKYDLMNFCYRSEVEEIVNANDITDYVRTNKDIILYIIQNRDFLRNAARFTGQNSFFEFLREYLIFYLERVILAISKAENLNQLQKALIEHHSAGWAYTACSFFKDTKDLTEDEFANIYVETITPIIINEILSFKSDA